MKEYRWGMRMGVALVALATGCTTDMNIERASQEVITPPLPADLNLTLYAKTTITVSPFATVNGDVASAAANGSVLYDVSAHQGYYYYSGYNTIANAITVRAGATIGAAYGNDLLIEGTAYSKNLGFDPQQMPAIPTATVAVPGPTNISVGANHAKQLCAGQYGSMTLGQNATLNLNGGVYHVTKLALGDGAKLLPSEPVIIFVTGGVTLADNAAIQPYPQTVHPMTAHDIRIEAGGAVTLEDNAVLRAHVLTNGKLTLGPSATLTGAAWAKTITIGTSAIVATEGTFDAQAPNVPPPCDDGSACTEDTCVGGGTASGICRNTPIPAGTSCTDGNACNGAEVCNATGACQAGTPPAAGTSCSDGDACNGAEVCDGYATCLPGDAPAVNDSNACTTDACDPSTGVSHEPLPDGATCNVLGTCSDGACSLEASVYSDAFVNNKSAPQQCARWNDFRANQLSYTSYNAITMSGSRAPLGITCSDPYVATQICQALHSGYYTAAYCDGHLWRANDCSTGVSIDTYSCSCTTSGYDLQPCNGAAWGGINNGTCAAPTQTLNVICQ